MSPHTDLDLEDSKATFGMTLQLMISSKFGYERFKSSENIRDNTD